MSNYSFVSAPSISMRRNMFTPKYNHDSTMQVGRLYPLYCQEVVPGETVSMDARSVLRSTSSFIRPLLSPMYIDSFYFFVPYRLVCDEFTSLFGESSPNDWKAKPNDKILPCFPQNDSDEDLYGGVLDCLGHLNGSRRAFGNVLHARAFAKIYNEWFRDENLIDPMLIHTGGDIHADEFPNMNEWAPNNYVGQCPKVAKYHDYFTSSLPNTQKGVAVTIPMIGENTDGFAYLDTAYETSAFESGNPIKFQVGRFLNGGYPWAGSSGSFPLILSNDSSNNGANVLGAVSAANPDGLTPNQALYGSNLGVKINLQDYSYFASINDLRFGFQLQKVLERLARSGSRYTEFIQSFFGVTNPDSRLQRSEFLGGGHSPINLMQVAQTSQSTETAELGSLGAYAWTNTDNRWSKSFTEYGCIIGCFVIRYPHTYSQGVEKFLTRKKMTDFYLPTFANISEQPVFVDELYTDGSTDIYNDDNRAVFGFQEAWQDIRTRKNRVSGYMNPRATNTLAVWGLYDNFENAPVLGQEFVEEDVNALNTKLSVDNSQLPPFMISLEFDQKIIIPMPLFSEPGLVDHH